MTRTSILGGVALLGVTIGLSAGLLAQDRDKTSFSQQQQQMTPEEKAMMEAWMAYATPGPAHEHLAKRAGEWDVAVTMWHDPDMPPEKSTATSTIKSIMGGRYIVEKVRGEAMGEPFEGMGVGGYDNLQQKFVGVWIDSMSTGILNYEGTASGDFKTVHYVGDHPDLMNDRYTKERSVEKMINEDKYVMTAFHTGPDGKEFKAMELVYTRTGK